MKRKSLIVRIGAIAIFAGGVLLFVACPNPVEEKPEEPRYTVSFSVGIGRGTAPASQTVTSGTVISLPEQGAMIAPEESYFYGWMIAPDEVPYTIYEAKASFTVTKNIRFEAQWQEFWVQDYCTVSFTVGRGSGTASASQIVTSGTVISLPEQGAMIAPEESYFYGWATTPDEYHPIYQVYAAKASFTVTTDTRFEAQWKSIGSDPNTDDPNTDDPNKTYVQFENLEEFPVIMYSDPSRQAEIARVPAKGTKLIETEPKPAGTVFYPQFLLAFEGIPLSYDGAAVMLRVDEKTVNRVNIPKLSSIQSGSAFIKIENNSTSAMTFTKGSLELSPIGANSTIIMHGESAAYRIEPGATNQYKAMNGSSPIAFPAQVSQFEAEMLYVFVYNGNALTLSKSQPVIQALNMLPAPASVNVSLVSASSISLTWAAVENATSYKVYRSSAPDGEPEFLATVSASPYTGGNLSAGTSYYYKVQALNAERESPLSAASVILILPAVQGLAAQVEDAASISLNWSAASGASAYKVYRSSDPDAEYELLDTLSVLTYTDESPSAGPEYSYKIQAVDAQTFGISPFAEITARILAAPHLSAQVESATSISLSWEAVEGATTYKVSRSSSPDTGFTLIETLSQQTYTNQGLSEENDYYYKLQGSNSQGDGVLSAGVRVKILPAPQQVQAQAAELEASITLSWEAATGASSYQVYRSTSSDTGFAAVGTTNTLSYTDENLNEGTTYYYKIWALNTTASGESPLSARVSATTPVLPGISNLTYSSVSGGTWTLQSDGSRKSPAIANGGMTKARVSFTSGSANQSVTIQLRVSSESAYDFAFISQLDNSSTTYDSGYYSRISGTQSAAVTIPVPTAGSHFVDIGYQKDGSAVSGSDCAWFTVTNY